LELTEKEDLSPWDSSILSVEYATREGAETTISLISSYNAFLRVWENHCGDLDFEQLQTLWELGKQVSAKVGMQDLKVVFPGSWRFVLRPLLKKFSSVSAD
jgi:hypothetical protein